MRLERGLVQVYTGDGKGKTTAAFGLALRAAGQGLRVYVVQFMKGRDTGEAAAVQLVPNISLTRFGRCSWVDMNHPDPQDVALAHDGRQYCLDVMASDEYDLVVLDEFNVALHCGLISLDQALSLLRARPARVELVLTGRAAHPQIIQQADLVTEMVAVKHPASARIGARRGIEY